MNRNSLSTLFTIAVLVFAAAQAMSQTSSFSSPDVDYVFELPDERWKMTVKPSAAAPNVEYVFGDRTEGHLEVRRLSMPAGWVISDAISMEEEKLQFMPGYVAGKSEPFAGFLNGSVFNFEFVRSGRPMSGRFYFLKTGDSSVHVLRFTGFRDKLRTIRNQTDAIARTFNVKKR